MNRWIILFAALIGALPVSAQRVDLDKEFFKHNFRRWPNKVLDASYSTYSVRVNQTATIDKYFKGNPAEKISIEGRKRLSSGGAIQVTVNLDDFIIESSGVKSREEVIKDKDGKETGKKKYYWVEVVHSFSAELTVYDDKGTRMDGYTLQSRETKGTWKSSEYTVYGDAAKYYDNNKTSVITKLVTTQVEEALRQAHSSVAMNYGFVSMNDSEILWTLGSKKHPEYEPYNAAIATAKTSLMKMTPNEIPEGISTDLAPAIDYFEALPGKYADEKEKSEKKLRYGAYFNLATMYFLMEDLEKANHYASKIVENDFDSKDGVKLQEDIAAVKKTLEKHGAKTRHFRPPFENVVAESTPPVDTDEDKKLYDQYMADRGAYKSANVPADVLQHSGRASVWLSFFKEPLFAKDRSQVAAIDGIVEIVNSDKIDKITGSTGIDLLVKKLEEGSYNDYIVQRIDDVPPGFFSEESRGRMLDLVKKPTTAHKSAILSLLAVLNHQPALELIKSEANNAQVGMAQRFNYHIFLSRNGYQESTAWLRTFLQNKKITDDTVYDMVPLILSTKQRPLVQWIVDALYDTQDRCYSSNPNVDENIHCGYRIIEFLAPVIKDYPFTADESGLNTDDYKAALITVRDWFRSHPNYVII